MESVVVVDVVRSPVAKGKPGGALHEIHAVDLLGQVLDGLMRRNPDVDPGRVDDVIIGCVSQAADQAGTPGRGAWLAAGFPEHVPSVTIDRRCGSSQQSVHFAAQGIMAGGYDIVVAGGVESMSRVPMGSARMGVDPFGTGVAKRYAPGLVPQGVSAELIAARWRISREEMDVFGARSHKRAAAARAAGAFDDEIVPIAFEAEDGPRRFDADETIRPRTTPEKLALLVPSFESAEYSRRFPEIAWSIHPGNSSQLSDAASAALVMSERSAEQRGLEPLARITALAVCGSDPLLMLTGPIAATEKLLKRSSVALEDIGHFEINEAFASVPLAWQREFGVPNERLNPLGGAIALGHPLGASGTRLLATMVHGMAASGERYGLQVMCEGGGMANAMLVENLRRNQTSAGV
ncbi:MAG TPA: thiolase family protein [Amycolatopsis sp.]|uniref:thiolase family protein n=1 Tax=Amycolatopsis sp. TaxID=37632 RepID=UPI002B493681|nr:thiolase family protein [Amycolatopsis sp.]HKS47026.1 thiolase family protein [Amycolatopsis sp.]